ncbi:hypothetical protein JCM5296_003040 [Sporobolomyces johnsonii]
MSTHWTYDALENLIEDIDIAGIDKPPTPVDEELRDAVVSLVDVVQELLPGKAEWAGLAKEYQKSQTYQEAVVAKLADVLWGLTHKELVGHHRLVWEYEEALVHLIEDGLQAAPQAPQDVRPRVRPYGKWSFRSLGGLLIHIYDQPSSADPILRKAVHHLVSVVKAKIGDKTKWASLWIDYNDKYRTRVLKDDAGITYAFQSHDYQSAVHEVEDKLVVLIVKLLPSLYCWLSTRIC